MFRFAPSLTGDMHIGDLRAALFNYICAKQQNDKFIVRIEDIYKKRNIEDKDILNILTIFGITYDHVYYQSDNFKYHLQFASTLLDEKKAFMCFCNTYELEAKKELAKQEKSAYKYDGTCENLNRDDIIESTKPSVIRIKKPRVDISFSDTIKGNLTFLKDSIDSFIILRVDKYPTYNFACAIDDMLQGVTYVIREEDHLSNTPKQEHVRHSLGYNEKIQYVHLPIILNSTGKKMIKEDDVSRVQWLLDQGYIPEAIINYLILLGNKTPKEIFTLSEALEWFDIKIISKLPVKFDLDKLKFLNKEHIKLLSDEELAKRVGYSSKNIGKIAKLYAKEKSTTFEIKQKIDALFAKKKTDGKYSENLAVLKNIIKDSPQFEEFDEFKRHLMQKSGFKGKFLFKPLEILLTNSENGPELAVLYPLIKNYIKEITQ
ncbi:MAG: glutamate--tRNA ligase [Epsilonproteobacteria bacterium]|nr:glutamate--tRNA ligase [Campylobacterota bacterium]